MSGKSEVFFRLSLACLILGILSAVFAPAEQTLGRILGLIYLHIGFVYGGLSLFIIAAVLSLIGREAGKTAYGLAIVSWVIYLVLSMIIAYLSWGNINWQEPRLIIGMNILFASIIVYLLLNLIDKPWSNYLLALGGAGAVAYWSTRWSMLHPAAPIRNSDSATIKLLALVSVISIILSLILLFVAVITRETKTSDISS